MSRDTGKLLGEIKWAFKELFRMYSFVYLLAEGGDEMNRKLMFLEKYLGER